MKKGKAPAFQFYSKDLLTDEEFLLMSAEERGVYLSSIAYSWIEGSIPGDALTLAKLIRLQPEEVERSWNALASKFKKKRGRANRLVNERLELQRRAQLLHHKKQVKAGQKGGLARWRKLNKQEELDSKPNRGAIASLKLASASASASAISSSLRSEEKDKTPTESIAPKSKKTSPPKVPPLAEPMHEIGFPLNDGSEWYPSVARVEEWKRLYPAVDVESTLRKIRGWDLSNRKKRKTKRGIEAHITGWLASDQDKGGAKGRTSLQSACQSDQPELTDGDRVNFRLYGTPKEYQR